MKRIPTLLFILAGVLRLAFHLLPTPIAWDASAYAGISKAIVSLGAGGLWEPLRPLIWPLLLSPFTLLGIDPLLAGHVLQLIIGMGVVWLVYSIAWRAFGHQAALWALGFAALSPLLAFYEHQLLTEQPAVFFALLAVFFLQRGRFVLAGAMSSLAFLTKFPEGIILVAVGGEIVISARDIRTMLAQGFRTGIGFAIPLVPFLILNMVLYKNPVASFVAANDVIATSGLWLYLEGPWFYFITLIQHNLFLAFALPGALLACRREAGKLSIALAAILILAYLVHLPHKEVRFLPMALPFIIILAGAGWNMMVEKFDGRHAFRWLVLILVAVFCAQALRWGLYFATYEGLPDPQVWHALYSQAARGDPLLVSSDPRLTLFTEQKIIPLYYPLFPQNLSLGLQTLDGAKTLLFNPCDTPCAPEDLACKENLAEFENIVRAEWTEMARTNGSCPFTIYARP